MYTITDISKITGISRERLKQYEKLGIIQPSQMQDAQAGPYSDADIDHVMMVDYYRTAGLGLPAISEISTDSTVAGIHEMLQSHSADIAAKMQELLREKAKTAKLIDASDKIEKYLDQFQIVNIPIPYVITEIDDYKSYGEYEEAFRKQCNMPGIMHRMKRRIRFDGTGIKSNKMVVVDENVAGFPKPCVYTVVKNSKSVPNPLPATYEKFMQYCTDHSLRVTGEIFVGMLLVHCINGAIESYMEVFCELR